MEVVQRYDLVVDWTPSQEQGVQWQGNVTNLPRNKRYDQILYQDNQ